MCSASTAEPKPVAGKDIMSVVLAAEYLGQKAEDIAASLPPGMAFKTATANQGQQVKEEPPGPQPPQPVLPRVPYTPAAMLPR